MPKDTRLSLVSGCIAGACEASATWPMEYIKTQLQSMQKIAGKPPPYTGVLSGLRYTVQTSGVLTLYTGLTPTLVFSVPKAGIRFGGNQFFRNLLKDPTTGNVSTGKAFLAGLAAGVTESIAVVTPQETIKTKLINLNMSPIDGIKHIMRTEGPIGLYSGLLSTCMKQGGNHGSRFMFMSEYKRMYKGHSEAKLKPIESFLGGMGAGLFSVLTTSPFDVVKTRMQSTQASAYSSTLDCFAQIARKEGLANFYSGSLARCFRVLPGQGIIFMSAEAIYNLLEQRFPPNGGPTHSKGKGHPLKRGVTG
jgi:solute carrier family 25 citrate transporter 1